MTDTGVVIIHAEVGSYKRAKAELESKIAIILAHIYKYQHYRQYSQGGHSWIKTVKRERELIEKLFEDYPRLREELDEVINQAWKRAKKEVIRDLKRDIELTERDFPKDCPYTWQDILDFCGECI